MKALCISVVAVLISIFSFAQVGLSTPVLWGKDAKTMKLNATGEAQLYFPFYLMPDTSKRMFVMIQPAIKWSAYYFKHPLIAVCKEGKTSFVMDEDPTHIYTNKWLNNSNSMKLTQLYMPVNLLIGFKNTPSLYIAPGLFAEYMTGGKFKRVYNDGTNHTIKNHYRDEPGFYGFNRFNGGVCAFVAYKFIMVYGVHSLRPMFKNGQGPDVQKTVVGLLINIDWENQMLKPF